jgi:prophage DNA circulation protein
MGSILDIHNPWRDALLPASFKLAEFHVEAMSEDSGRRLVVHEFPKKELPYVEDMGKRTMSYTVRGYVIAYVRDTDYSLYQRDYRIARDRLRDVLDEGGAGRLQLPSIASVIVACDRYRMTEEQRLGGYATFDMLFTEQGALETPPPSSRQTLMDRSRNLREQVLMNLSQSSVTRQETLGGLLTQTGRRRT